MTAAVEPAPPLVPGVTIAPGYRVLGHLARSRRLDVYDVWSETRASRCIIKRLRPDCVDHARARRRMATEGRLLARLTHPHIVRGYELIVEPQPMVVMETLRGSTLEHLLDEAGRPMADADVAQLGLQLAGALHHIHGAGWLHLDLKPSNIVADNGRAVVIDLSVARRPGPAHGGVGTWCYMAPEQARGGMLDAAADIWGLGVVLYEALTGALAFDSDSIGSDDPAIATGAGRRNPDRYPQLAGRPTPIRRLRRRASAPLVALIEACMEPAPTDRPDLPAVLAELATLTDALPAWVLPRSE